MALNFLYISINLNYFSQAAYIPSELQPLHDLRAWKVETTPTPARRVYVNGRQHCDIVAQRGKLVSAVQRASAP
jgi:hypothetical protein